jgi:hypothetical protein
MSKLASALGSKYEQNKLSILTRSFELGNHTFKVRVPSVGEIEEIYNYFKNPDEAVTEQIYQELIANLVIDPEDKVEKTDNDTIVEGRSMREAAKNKNIMQYRIVRYIQMLVPETGSLDDLTYADVESEFPLAIQLTLIDKINEVISPDYKDIKSK